MSSIKYDLARSSLSKYCDEFGFEFDSHDRINHFIYWFTHELKNNYWNIDKRPNNIRNKSLAIVENHIDQFSRKTATTFDNLESIDDLVKDIEDSLVSFYEDENDMYERYFDSIESDQD